MELIQGEVFKGKAVKLDGNHFHSCHFDKNSTLVYEGGEWADTNSTFEPGIKLTFTGAAGRTMQIMARFGMIRQIPMPPQPAAPAPKPPSAVH